MNCPRCGTSNLDSLSHCVRCGAELVAVGDAETFVGVSLPPTPAAKVAAAPAPASSTPPRPGDTSNAMTAGPWAALGASGADQVDFGPRYRIDRLLGQGGMGAVYKAWDKELERPVALKLIRPGLAQDPAVAQRFKQELLLASKISHKNILRIHDLGEAAGVKFISMAFVEGEDLYFLLQQHGKLPVERALKIARQLCAALQAAHSEGVVHRDLKPQNILLDKQENVYVSDFGLAKSLEHDTGMTKSGEFLGTPRYMAPEQVSGGKIDHRADLYALGLILYEMVTGDVPFHADSTLQLMYKRVHEIPKSPKTINAALPDWLVRVIMKCIERDPEVRYQSAGEILHDLETGTGPKSRHGTMRITLPSGGIEFSRLWLFPVAIVVLAAAVLAVPALRQRLFRLFGHTAVASANHQPVSVLVADFTNHTGDPVFDGTLEPMVNLAMEGASFINGFNRGAARKLAQKLPNPTDRLDEQPARLVAVSQGISAVITGEISRRGNDYRVAVEALDARTGNTLGSADVSAANKDQVLLAVPKLIAPIRKALGDNTPESAQLEKTGGAFTTTSLEAVHQYGVGMEEQFSGQMEAALRSFSKAAELDPNFARAYAGMAAASGNLGKRQDAEKYAKLALEHVDRMTERERYRIRGQYYYRTGNWQKCVEEYGELVKQYPADNIGQNNLASCFVYLRNMSRGMEEAQRAVQIDPRSVATRMNFALDACYSGDFSTCEREGREVQKLNPVYDEGFLVLAYAQLGQGQLQQATQTYQVLEKSGGRGASLAAAGVANLALYEGRLREAIQVLENGAAADLAAKRAEAAADKFVMLAYARLWSGQQRAAMAAADQALANSQSVKIRFLSARTFVEAGEIAKARKLAASLGAELLAEPQAYAKLILGEAAMKEHNPKAAIQLFTESSNLIDTWFAHFDLGRAYLEAGAFAEADSEFDRCIKRRGEALELFMDDMPTYSYFPPVYYYQGRVREGLKSAGFADSYRTYLSIRDKAGEDPLVAEIHRRLGR